MKTFGEPAVKVTQITEEGYMELSSPVLSWSDPHSEEVKHFLDCCSGVAECIVKVDEAVKLMELIDAVYESAKTGETVRIK